MFALSNSRQECFDHYAADELSVLFEEKLNELQAARHGAERRYPRKGRPLSSQSKVRDIETELNLIEEELILRANPAARKVLRQHRYQ